MIGLSTRYSGMVFALVTACGLGAITTMAKVFYSEGGDAGTLMLVRFLASTLAFGLLLLIRRNRFTVDRAQRLPLLLIGLFWSGGMICYLSAVETLSVSLAVLFFYSYPLLVLAWSIVNRQLKASAGLVGLFVAAFTGLYLALSGGDIRIDVNGLVFALMAACGAAFTFVSGARVAPTMSPLLMTFWVNAAGIVLIAPMLFDGISLPDTANGLLALLLATLFYLVAILSQFEALARLPAARAAFLLNLEPVVSILLARLVLDEILSLTQVSGVILVISVVILSIRFKPSNA
ncbi:MAG: DMT family transporter [Gammaproteobacteria bacterium]|nr:DMT family transporter [Gammaproteobacteria bacterium]